MLYHWHRIPFYPWKGVDVKKKWNHAHGQYFYINTINKRERNRQHVVSCTRIFDCNTFKNFIFIVCIKTGIKSKRVFLILFLLPLLFHYRFSFYRTLTNSSKPQQQRSRLLLLLLLFFCVDRSVCCCWLMFDVRHQQCLNSHMCDFFCVENEKNSCSVSLLLFSPSLVLYLMWSLVVEMFFSAWFVWIEILSTLFSLFRSSFFTVFFIIGHQRTHSFWKVSHQENSS